jgi:glutamate-1-semialdehyde aminotransferase
LAFGQQYAPLLPSSKQVSAAISLGEKVRMRSAGSRAVVMILRTARVVAFAGLAPSLRRCIAQRPSR